MGVDDQEKPLKINIFGWLIDTATVKWSQQ